MPIAPVTPARSASGAGFVVLLLVFALFAFLVPVRTCPSCSGVGRLEAVPGVGIRCTHCDGAGRQTLWEIVRDGGR